MAEYKDLSKFYNTYHFVPLGKEVNRKEQKKDKLYTGKIEVELTTKTPLFIPNLPERTISADGHKTYDFFTYDGKSPVIPGSALRGMLRNMYETVTNSCLSVVDLDEKPVRRTNATYSPGLIHFDENGNIALYKAGKAVVKNNVRPDFRGKHDRYMDFVEGKEVRIAKPQIENRQNITSIVCLPEEFNQYKEKYTEVQKWLTGYYFKGEAGVKKKRRSLNAYVFYLNNSNNPNNVVCSDLEKYGALQELKDVIASYNEYTEQTNKSLENELRTSYNGYKEYREQLEHFLDTRQGYFPVHYSKVASYLYLSPACITKEVYYSDINTILIEQDNHVTCSNIKEMCPACRLFGMVGSSVLENEDYPNAWASSVKVQDAVLVDGQSEQVYYEHDITLMELASPKKSSTEFYLQKPTDINNEEVISWTYDYYVVRRTEDEAAVKRYKPKISGRKFYWHHQNPNLPEKNVDKSIRNCTVRPVNPTIKFKFTIAFEKITEKQLNQLIWLCNISNMKDKKGQYGYKLGKGKPLGMGSIELKVLSVKIRSLKASEEIGYYLSDYNTVFGLPYEDITYASVGFDAEIKNAFMKMCDFESTKGYPVTYPVSANQSVKIASDGYKWFVYNHYNFKGGNTGFKKREELEFQQYMKAVTDDDNLLFVNAETDYCFASCIPVVSATEEPEIDKNNSVGENNDKDENKDRCCKISDCRVLKEIKEKREKQKKEKQNQQNKGQFNPKKNMGKNSKTNNTQNKGQHKNNNQKKSSRRDKCDNFNDFKKKWPV